MQNTDIKTKGIIIVIVIIALATIGLYIHKQTKEENYIESEIENQYEEIENNEIQEENITIHITGEVQYPGVVVLKNNARIVDAIEAAGGETEDADLNRLNLAHILNDGDKVYVPNINEENTEINVVDLENEKQTTININNATIEELIELPGIGEATANKIIEYRKQNGKFESIEELKNVPGIGNSKFETLKEMIRVK